MKELEIRNLIKTYCSIAKLKEKERFGLVHYQGMILTHEITATHVFGAQQLAWLLWSESGLKIDIFKVNILLAFSEVGTFDVPDEVKAFVDEFEKNSTAEAQFAHMCSDFEELLQTESKLCIGDVLDFLGSNYPQFPIKLGIFNSAVRRYFKLSALKTKTRRGWICWNVKVPHREVVSEHVFGTQSLAWLIHLATNSNLNMNKVTAMLALHETEESVMEDYVPYDPVTPEQLLAEGKAAVEQVLGGLKQYEMFEKLLDEFNARETPEAQFAHLCDKLECNFRAKMYTDRGLCPIEDGQEDVIADPEVQENLKKGAKTVSDLFLMHIMHEYVGTPFEEIANVLRTYDTTQN